MRSVLASLAALLILAGCGYKGPLYLPKPKPAAQQPAQPAPAQPAEAKPVDGPAAK
jgi:predicted small lipoprotein YifL